MFAAVVKRVSSVSDLPVSTTSSLSLFQARQPVWPDCSIWHKFWELGAP